MYIICWRSNNNIGMLHVMLMCSLGFCWPKPVNLTQFVSIFFLFFLLFFLFPFFPFFPFKKTHLDRFQGGAYAGSAPPKSATDIGLKSRSQLTSEGQTLIKLQLAYSLYFHKNLKMNRADEGRWQSVTRFSIRPAVFF